MAIAVEARTEAVAERAVQESWRPQAYAVPELASDQLTRRRASRFIGSLALGETVDSSEYQLTNAYSLMHATREAAAGDSAALAMVKSNVRTDVVERTIKSGHVTKVALHTDDNGHILQYGQYATDIQANSLRFAAGNWVMRERTEAETRNMFRIEEVHRQGLLEDYAFVVFSRAADNMSQPDMQQAGFFTDTMSCAIQVTTANQGQVMVESAFVAGKQRWDAERHDKQTITAIGEVLGVELAGKTATELLDTPLLVPKSLLPNGAIDLVKLYDDCAGGTFFGEAKPQQDYSAYGQRCAEREAAFLPRVEVITRQLIAEADQLTTPQLASQRLSQLSQQEMLEQSIQDTSIEARVFGEAAAYRIEQARFYHENGQLDLARRLTTQAQSVARSSSCPGGAASGNGAAGPNTEELSATSESDGENPKDCDFVSKECPKCHKKNVRTVVRNGKYYGACGCHS